MPIDISIEGECLKIVTSHISSGLRQWILLETAELDGSTKTTGIHLLDASLFSVEEHADKGDTNIAGTTKNIQNMELNRVEAAESTMSSRSLQLDALAQHAAYLIGYSDNGRLIFLDTKSWVCSADLENLGTGLLSYSKHFFVPYYWFSGVRDILCAVVKKNILFARNDGIAIMKGGLE